MTADPRITAPTARRFAFISLLSDCKEVSTPPRQLIGLRKPYRSAENAGLTYRLLSQCDVDHTSPPLNAQKGLADAQLNETQHPKPETHITNAEKSWLHGRTGQPFSAIHDEDCSGYPTRGR